MNKRKYVFFILAALVILAGALTIKNKLSNKNKPIIQADLGIPTELINVGKGDIVEGISYIGTIKPKKSSTVSPTIGGQILNIYVEEGSIVKAGDLLASIDDTQLVASLNTALKKLETLKVNYDYLTNQIQSFYDTNPLVKKLKTLTSNYEYIKDESEKYKRLYDEGAVAKSMYDKTKQEADTAYFQLKELEATISDTYNKLVHEKNITEKQLEEVSASINELNIKIEDTLIKAPIQGIVKKIYCDEGDLAVMGKPFADIDNNGELLVKANITESDINKINIGSKAVLNINGLNKDVIAEVSKIIPNVNPNTRVGEVEIGPIKVTEEVMLVSGNSVEVNIITNEATDKIVIPKVAIKNLNGQNMVYLYEDGIVKEKEISTGLTVGENTEVIEGLKEGDKIAIKNLSKLYENAKVYVFKGVDQ